MLLGQRNSPAALGVKPYLRPCWGGHVSSWLRLLGVCHRRHALTELPAQTDLGLHRNTDGWLSPQLSEERPLKISVFRDLLASLSGGQPCEP